MESEGERWINYVGGDQGIHIRKTAHGGLRKQSPTEQKPTGVAAGSSDVSFGSQQIQGCERARSNPELAASSTRLFGSFGHVSTQSLCIVELEKQEINFVLWQNINSIWKQEITSIQ